MSMETHTWLRDVPGTLRGAMGLFATGVSVLTTTLDGQPHGMTANAVCSVSLDPPLVLVCIREDARIHDVVLAAGSFAVTVLGANQGRVSEGFARQGAHPDQRHFDTVRWSPAPHTGHPVLDEGLAYVDCEIHDVHPGGDHSIIVGAVRDLGELRQDEPLIFYDGNYRELLNRPDARS